jgi:predicted membrane channel-forming protein YqfA (hemolysin III family)
LTVHLGEHASHHPVHWRTRHKRLVDFLAYVAISLIVVASIVIAALEGASWTVIAKTFLFMWVTAPVFTYFISENRTLWRQGSFWWLTTVLFLLHCGVWLYILRKTNGPPGGRYFLLASLVALFVERVLFRRVRGSILNRSREF